MANKRFWLGILAMVLVFGITVVGCDDGSTDNNGGVPNLSGNITISPSTDVTAGTLLTATYTGNEDVTYQWKRGNTNVGTNTTTHLASEFGSYTVTVSATGYKSKTSAAVTVLMPGFTLTGIPAEYNGKYAIVKDISENIFGYNSYTYSQSQGVVFKAALISNGSVSLPMHNEASNIFVLYEGNGTFDLVFYVFNTETVPESTQPQYPVVNFSSVTFSRGSASRSYDQRTGGTGTIIGIPTADPPAGNFAGSAAVTLSTTTTGASIYYTTDGTNPTASSTLYSSPISVTSFVYIRAIAIKDGARSDVLTANYSIYAANRIFTVTGIPSQYDGKYACLRTSDRYAGIHLAGAQGIDTAKGTYYTAVPISNGSVSVPMWEVNTNSSVSPVGSYAGNHTVDVTFIIRDSLTGEFGNATATIKFTSVTFASGSATRAWSAGTEQ